MDDSLAFFYSALTLTRSDPLEDPDGGNNIIGGNFLRGASLKEPNFGCCKGEFFFFAMSNGVATL